MQTEVKPEWITYEEAQRLTSLGRTTLWRICSGSEVKTARIGRSVRIHLPSLREFMEQAAEDSNIERR